MSEGQEYDFSDAVNPFESGGSSYDFSDAVNPFESEPNSPSSEKAETDPGVISNIPNTMRRVGERSVELGGNLIEFIGSVAEKGGTALTEFTGVNPGIQWGDDGISFTMNVDPQNDIGGAVQDFGAKGADVDFGYQPTFTWEGLKEDITPSNLAGYIIEQGVGSVPDMAAAMATLPAYIMSRTQEIAETRSLNKDQAEVTARDLAESVIPAVSVSLLERFGAKGVFKPKGATGFKQIGREAGKAAAKEGLTEFAQEQVEYAGETVGTENPFDWGTSLDRGAAGAVAGSGQ